MKEQKESESEKKGEEKISSVLLVGGRLRQSAICNKHSKLYSCIHTCTRTETTADDGARESWSKGQKGPMDSLYAQSIWTAFMDSLYG